MNKMSKIVKCVFTNEWKNPSGGFTYYHELTMDNGDVGSCGSTEKYPAKLREGNMVEYTLEGKKIKITLSSAVVENNNNTKKTGSFTGKGMVKKQDDFLGYAWSYAKDLIIAGKTMEDAEELKKMAQYIYEEIGKQLKNDQ
jgi:hypothetical protein